MIGSSADTGAGSTGSPGGAAAGQGEPSTERHERGQLQPRDARRSELARRLSAVRDRITVAASEAGRDPAGVTLIVVTKTFPASDVRLLAGLGVRDIGENRDQDAAVKAVACADLDLVWHFVGQLQTNKAHSVAQYCRFVHSVDRMRLVRALDRAARGSPCAPITCLIQVTLDAAPGRGGVLPAGMDAVAGAIADATDLELGGVMAVAPLGADAAEAFDRLRAVADALRSRHPAARLISCGMSGDLEAAVRAGATHVRVGSAILGTRVGTG